LAARWVITGSPVTPTPTFIVRAFDFRISHRIVERALALCPIVSDRNEFEDRDHYESNERARDVLEHESVGETGPNDRQAEIR
jgi:hypothetical protein